LNLNPCDFDNDHDVDFGDYAVFASYWKSGYNNNYNAQWPIDADQSGTIDIMDFDIFTDYWLEPTPYEVPDVNLIAHWKLDESEGIIAHDNIGSNNGTLNGDPNWQPIAGKVDGALKFNGTDNYISTDFVLNPADRAFSVFAWIKGGDPGQVIISQMNHRVGRTVYPGSAWLGTDPSEGKLVTMLMDPQFGPLESESVIIDSEWHHVGLVYNLDEFHRYLYVDGIEVAKDTSIVGGVGSNGGLYIGAGKALGEGSFFLGLIDDVRIYKVALSTNEIEEMTR
jgi:hypothetical protein